MKAILIAMTLVLGCMGGAFAQGKNKTSNGASAQTRNTVDVTSIMIGGATGGPAGAAVAATGGGWYQPQLLMTTTATAAPSTFNECGVSVGFALWLASYSESSEGIDCVAQRQAQFAAQVFGDAEMAYESMCHSPKWTESDKTLGRNRCPKNRVAVKPVTMAAAKVPTRAECLTAISPTLDDAGYRAAVASCPAQ